MMTTSVINAPVVTRNGNVQLRTPTQPISFSKCLEVNDLNGYLLSMMTGPALSRIFHEVVRMLQSILMSYNTTTLHSPWHTRGLRLLQYGCQTLAESVSWQAVLVHSMTMMLSENSGSISPACRALGIQVLARKNYKRRVLWLIVLQVMLPKLYQRIKEKFLENQLQNDVHGLWQEQQGRQFSLQLVARHRRKHARKKVFQTIDAVMPLVRLGVLINCWKSLSSSSSKSKTANVLAATPNLALILSGLAYTAASDGMPSAGTTASSSNKSNMQSFFVMYAYRRWMHQEGMALGPILGEPLLVSMRETYHMVRQMILEDNPLAEQWRLWAIGRARIRRRRQLQQAIDSKDKLSCGATKCDGTSSPCPLCGIHPIPLPFQIESCGHVACYTCLWDYIGDSLKRQKLSGGHRKGSFYNKTRAPIPNLPPCPVCYDPIEHCAPK